MDTAAEKFETGPLQICCRESKLTTAPYSKKQTFQSRLSSPQGMIVSYLKAGSKSVR